MMNSLAIGSRNVLKKNYIPEPVEKISKRWTFVNQELQNQLNNIISSQLPLPTSEMEIDLVNLTAEN